MAAAIIGSLLQATLDKIHEAESGVFSLSVATRSGGNAQTGEIPIVLQVPRNRPERGEAWEQYKERIDAYLSPIYQRLGEAGVVTRKLITANALAANVKPEIVPILQGVPDIELLELDPLVQLTNMDDVLPDIGYPAMRQNHPTLDGTGVTLAVLDSGIDKHHPFLNVADSVETCGESVDIPGTHGTHCAGSIASTDPVFGGVAPGVTLLNIKVLLSDGSGQHTFITRGIDEALDRGAQVLSMSIGFNHLPTRSWGGHGWVCTDGKCTLCTAVDNAVLLDGTAVVVAAGNEHNRAEDLRRLDFGNSFDTELGCPGQAREAITVAAINKDSHQIAPFSSHGPTAYGDDKITIAAPGVNIMSTIPVPRDSHGQPKLNPSRSLLFGSKSGTSMATPTVAGIVAILVQERLQSGMPWNPHIIRAELVSRCASTLNLPADQVGVGRLYLSNL